MTRPALSIPVDTPALEPDSGLCSTCIHRETCGFGSHNDEPVLFCEEFTPIETSGRKSIAIIAKRLRPVLAPDLDEESDEWIGLCKSCANRQRCILRKPVGGVWHCEEFA